MKKVIFAIGLVVLLASCSSAVKEEAAVVADSTVVAVETIVAPLVVVGSTGVTGVAVDSTKK